MSKGMDAEDFRRWVGAMSAMHPAPSEDVVAVVRCEDEWRTVFADGSWHPGRPYSRAVMDEMARMVDDYRVEARELRHLAELWHAIENKIDTAGDTVADAAPAAGADAAPAVGAQQYTDAARSVGAADDARIEELEAAVAAENRAAAAAAHDGIIDVEILEEIRRAPAQPGVARIELNDVREVPGSTEEMPRTRRPRTGAENFVPWSVVESMIDAELDGYFESPS